MLSSITCIPFSFKHSSSSFSGKWPHFLCRLSPLTVCTFQLLERTMGHHRLSRSQRIERLRRSLCIALHHLYSSGRTGFQVNFIIISTNQFNNKILNFSAEWTGCSCCRSSSPSWPYSWWCWCSHCSLPDPWTCPKPAFSPFSAPSPMTLLWATLSVTVKSLVKLI